MYIRTFILVLSVVISLTTTAQKNKAIDEFTSSKGLEHAQIGISVKDMSGNTIASHNADIAITPASTMKIITTATAFELLGSQYKFQTTLAKDIHIPNRLIVTGYGDPTLGSDKISNSTDFLSIWRGQIKQVFSKSTPLDIFINDSYFGYKGVSDKWLREDIGNYYAAGTYGISIFDNTYKLLMNTTRRDTTPVLTRTEPQMDIRFVNTLKLNTTGSDNGFIVGEPFSNDRLLIGNVPAGKTMFSIKGSIPNPGLYLGETLASALKQDGFSIAQVSTSRTDYLSQSSSSSKSIYSGKVFHTHYSPVLREIAREVNFKSNNHYAEHLLSAIGRQANKDIYTEAQDEGIKAIKDFWKMKGLDTESLFIYDGCGLSPSDAVSPSFMCDVLVYMQAKSKNADDFLYTMPKAGQEGTVRNLFKGTSLSGYVYAKSGSIANVRCYAGYYIKKEKKYAFSVMVNNYNGSSSQVIKAIEALLPQLFK